MSRIDEFCSLVRNKETTRQQVIDFLNTYNYQIDINTPNNRDIYPIEYVVLYGNAEVLDLFIKNLDAKLTLHHNFTGLNLLELCESNEETKAYLIDPANRVWEYFNNGLTALHIYACSGHLNEIQNILRQDINTLFFKSDETYYALDWAFKFSQYHVVDWLENHILKLIPFYESTKDYGTTAKLYDVLAHFYINTKNEIKKGLDYCYEAKNAYELGLTEFPNNEEYEANLSIILLNIAIISTSLEKFDMQAERTSYLVEKACQYFYGTSCTNIREFNNKLVSIYLHRIEAIDKHLKAIDFNTEVNFHAFKILNDQLIELNTKIETLFKQIPEDLRTAYDNAKMEEAFDRTIDALEQQFRAEKKIEDFKEKNSKSSADLNEMNSGISHETKKFKEFSALCATLIKSAKNASDNFNYATSICQWEYANRYLKERVAIMNDVKKLYEERADLQCEKISVEIKKAFEEIETHTSFLREMLDPPSPHSINIKRNKDEKTNEDKEIKYAPDFVASLSLTSSMNQIITPKVKTTPSDIRMNHTPQPQSPNRIPLGSIASIFVPPPVPQDIDEKLTLSSPKPT